MQKSASAGNGNGKEQEDDFGDAVDQGEVEMTHEDRHEAWRFLLAGGVAGAGMSSCFFPLDIA